MANRSTGSRTPGRELLWLSLPWLLLITVLALAVTRDIAHAEGFRTGSLLSPAPALAGIRGRPRQVLAVSSVAVAVSLSASSLDAWEGLDYHLTTLSAVLAVSLTSYLASVARQRRAAQLTQVQRVAEAAQLALLPPVPHRVGELRLEARYVAAESEARIGGDLYEAVVGRDHTRLIIGDVRGKGLPAIRTAGAVLGAFREAAHHEPTLPRVAVRCSEAVGRLEGDSGDLFSGSMAPDELFVTAVVVEIEGPTIRVVNLGHPRPLLLTRHSVHHIGCGESLPPLGLAHLLAGGDFSVSAHEWQSGERLLLYTDGIYEARDARGSFFPLVDVTGDLLDASTERLPDLLLAAVARHTGHELRDDAALVVAEWSGPSGAWPAPSDHL